MFDELVIANDGKFQEKVLTCLYDNVDFLRHIIPVNCPSSDVVPVQHAVTMLS